MDEYILYVFIYKIRRHGAYFILNDLLWILVWNRFGPIPTSQNVKELRVLRGLTVSINNDDNDVN